MIYDLNYKDFTKMMNDFGKTVYGKAMFVICFTPFLFCLVVSFMTTISFINNACVLDIFAIAKIIFITICLLCLGCYYFYKELRIFQEKRNNKNKVEEK